MIAPFRRLARRLSRRPRVPSTLPHAEAARLLVDYHFGRLSPERSAAVEAHVRTCGTCQREGLDHAYTQQQIAMRRLDSVRATRPTPHGRHAMLFLAAALAIAALLSLGVAQFASWAGRVGSGTTSVPAALVAHMSLALSTTGAAGVTSDPSGNLLAVANVGSTATVTIWQAHSGLLVRTLAWPGSAAPASLAWSPDGRELVASDGKVVGMWSLASGTLTWAEDVPTAISAAIYVASTGQIASLPPLAQDLAQHAFLQWGADSSLLPAPAGAAAPLGATLPGGALVGMWRATGTHLVSLPGGAVAVGDWSTSAAGDLDWSPDGRFVLWSRVVQSVALPPAPGQAEAQGAPTPNPPLAAVAARLAARGTGDALAWFTPDGRALALCDRSSTGASLQVIDLKSTRVQYSLGGACDGLAVTSAAWLAGASPQVWTLALAQPNHPVQEFAVRIPSLTTGA